MEITDFLLVWAGAYLGCVDWDWEEGSRGLREGVVGGGVGVGVGVAFVEGGGVLWLLLLLLLQGGGRYG